MIAAADGLLGDDRARHWLAQTRAAFDSVASDYDGSLGNNVLAQRMRERLQHRVLELFPPGSRLLDIGCGTGLDAVFLARRGYQVVATDWSPAMVARTRARAAAAGLDHRVSVHGLGLQEMLVLADEPFDGLYSDLGPLNCAPDLGTLAAHCRALLRPGGYLVASVIGRFCPWEWAVWPLRGNPRRATVRFSTGMVPVPLNGQTVWMRYLTPGEMTRAFASEFEGVSSRALSLFLPPPYLAGFYQRHPRLGHVLGLMDDALGGAPPLRNAGDHFLLTLRRRD